jgi:hypothetical protein
MMCGEGQGSQFASPAGGCGLDCDTYGALDFTGGERGIRTPDRAFDPITV